MQLKNTEGIVQEGKGKDWYMANTSGLKDVTSEKSNPAVGILNMEVKAPQGDAAKVGVVAQVEIETAAGWFDATVFHAKDDDSNLYVSVDSRKYQDSTGKDKYHDSFRLKVPAKAQILRHVRSLCEDSPATQAGAVSASQPQAQVAGMTPEMFAQFQAFMTMQAQQQAQAGAQPSVPGIIGQGDKGTF